MAPCYNVTEGLCSQSVGSHSFPEQLEWISLASYGLQCDERIPGPKFWHAELRQVEKILENVVFR